MSTFWISQCADKMPIFAVQADEPVDGVLTVNYGGMGAAYYLGEGENWHRTKDEAEARARHLRTLKIASLQTEINRIAALSEPRHD